MLGQIDFAPWQCLAELIDNSIDAFIEAKRSAFVLSQPRIHISLPTSADLDRGLGVLAIQDNATGMRVEMLGQAVRAGYSGNDPVDKMGLFGMGFNIATARLGRRTEVWTTTVDSPEWMGIVIDFDDLERQQAFRVPVTVRQKSEAELDAPVHGTRIEIHGLEPVRMRSLNWGAGKAKTKKRLGKIYGRVMADLGIEISYDGDAIKPWRHCIWNPSRSVPTAEFGNVPARIEIDEALEPRRFCATCWVWLAATDEVCSACGHSENVIVRRRQVRGWLGVQRYFDKEHFGIDLVRNGRVIEELDKSMFTFRDSAGEELFEYPRDAMHWGGRIVGELEVDFVRVSHQKDSFDKLDPEWKQVVGVVRGDSPLQPKIAERKGLARNTSPLARLFSGYRKGIAGLKNLVPGDASGVGLNTGPVRDYVDKFYEGLEEYQDDSKWYDLVLQAERKKRGGSAGSDDVAGPFPIEGGESTSTGEAAPPATDDEAKPTEEPVTGGTVQRDSELSRTYELEMPSGKTAIVVAAFQHSGSPPDDEAFSISANGYQVDYDYYPQAAFFEQSLETPVDCLVTDLAQHFLAVSAASPRSTPVSLIAYELRRRYFPRTLTTVSVVADEAEALLHELRAFYDEALIVEAPIELGELSGELVRQVRLRALNNDAATDEQAMERVRRGEFARYVDNHFLLEIVRKWPALPMDASFFALPYEALSPELRASALETVSYSLEDVRWLADEAFGAVSKDNPWRLRFNRAIASLRLLQYWRV
jgi:hypothetical protein